MNIWVSFDELYETRRIIREIHDDVFSSKDEVQREVDKLNQKFENDIHLIENSLRVIDYDLSCINYAISCNSVEIKNINNEKSNTSTGDSARIEALDRQKAPYVNANKKLEEMRNAIYRTRDNYDRASKTIRDQQSSLIYIASDFNKTVDSVCMNLDSLSGRIDNIEKVVKQITDELDPSMDGVHITDALQFVSIANEIKEEADRLGSERKALNTASINMSNNLQDEVSKLASSLVEDMNGNNSVIKILDNISDSLYRVEQLVKRYNGLGV